ncbi:MAG: hypothetical protein ACRDF6_12780, partial [bacterium]
MLERKVEIDSLVITASSFTGLGAGDSASATYTAVHEYDGVPDTIFQATVRWNSTGVFVSGDLTPADIDFAGFSPTEGWIVKILDYTRVDTVTFSPAALMRTAAVPESMDVSAEVSAETAAELPGQGYGINEMRIGQPGLDLSEYVELDGPPGAMLDSLSYVVVSNDPAVGLGVVTCAVRFDGQVMPQDGRFLVAESTFESNLFGAVPDYVPPPADSSLLFVDGSPATHFLVSRFFGNPGLDLDQDDDGQLDFRPWRDILDCVSLSYGHQTVLPAGHRISQGPGYCGLPPVASDTLQHIWRRCDGVEWQLGAQAPPATDTPGAPNPCPLPTAVEPRPITDPGLLGWVTPNPTAGGRTQFVLRLPRAARIALRVL